MREISVRIINNEIYKAFLELCFMYDESTRFKIQDAYEKSEGRERNVLKLLIENEKLAKENNIPLCQDTGMAVVNMEIGQDVRFVDGDIKEAVNDGVRRAVSFAEP